MLEFLNRFWILLPLSFALTVAGLVSGYRHGGVPAEGRFARALRAGLPVMLGGMIAWQVVLEIVESGIKSPPFPTLHTLLAMIFLLSASALTGLMLGRRTDASVLERGTLLLNQSPRASVADRPDALTLAGQFIPLLDETKHFKIIGTTGTGKSTAIRELLTGAFRRGDRAIITDPDGDYLQRFFDAERGDVILNPFDTRSARWDLFAEIILPQDADQLARSFIPDHHGQDQVWRGFARTYVSSILRQLHRAEDHSLSKLWPLLVGSAEQDLHELLEGTSAAPFLGKAGGKFLQSVQSVTIHHLSAIEHLARQDQENILSVRRWTREGRGVLFLPYKNNEIASLSNLISTWMRLAIFEALSAPEGDQRLWFVIDELAALGAIDGLKDALTRLRKVGGRCILGLQSIGQVSGAHGEAESQSIVENAATTLILRCSASEHGGTAEFASRLIGKRQIVRKQHSTSRSSDHFFQKTRTVSDQVFTEDAVMASEIEQLPDLTGFLKLASQPYWQKVSLAPATPETSPFQKYSWTATHVASMVAAITTLTLVTHLTGAPPVTTSPEVNATATATSPKATSFSPVAAWHPVPPAHPSPVSSQHRATHAHQSDPREITVGASGISNRYKLLSVDRKPASSGSDELIVRLHVESLATEPLVSPFESDMLALTSRESEPIAPKISFRHPVPSGNSLNQDIVFNIPSSLSLKNTTLQIHYYSYQKEIPLDLPPTARASATPPISPQ